MIQARMSEKRSVPWWAAIGAPVIGVPLLVGLLALTAPAKAPVTEVEVGTTTEQVEVQTVDNAVELPADYRIEPSTANG